VLRKGALCMRWLKQVSELDVIGNGLQVAVQGSHDWMWIVGSTFVEEVYYDWARW